MGAPKHMCAPNFLSCSLFSTSWKTHPHNQLESMRGSWVHSKAAMSLGAPIDAGKNLYTHTTDLEGSWTSRQKRGANDILEWSGCAWIVPACLHELDCSSTCSITLTNTPTQVELHGVFFSNPIAWRRVSNCPRDVRRSAQMDSTWLSH